jgi:hypothetical protein
LLLKTSIDNPQIAFFHDSFSNGKYFANQEEFILFAMMGLREKKYWLACLLALCACLQPVASQQDEGGENVSLYYIGANGSLSIRKAAYEFDAVELRQDTARHNLLMLGFALGRRFEFSPVVRLGIGAAIDFGSVIEDTIQTDIDDYVLVKQWFLHVGLDPELQFALAKAGAIEPYVFIGGGINYNRMRSGFALYDDPRREAEFRNEANMPSFTEKRWSPHAHGGAGFDYMPRREIGISIRYSFRFSKPVAYEEAREFPIASISYYELFLTHMIQLQILFQFED